MSKLKETKTPLPAQNLSLSLLHTHTHTHTHANTHTHTIKWSNVFSIKNLSNLPQYNCYYAIWLVERIFFNWLGMCDEFKIFFIFVVISFFLFLSFFINYFLFCWLATKRWLTERWSKLEWNYVQIFTTKPHSKFWMTLLIVILFQ